MRQFKGRAVLAGRTEGEALVSRRGFNTYASFFTSIHTSTTTAICADHGNPDLLGWDLANGIICLPTTTGSTSGGAVWQRLAHMGVLPKAMLFSQPIDPLAAGGLVVADIWAAKRVITVDRLGPEFLETVENGDRLGIHEDGTVVILKPSPLRV
jgi:predicted aconitase with swiveling domain